MKKIAVIGLGIIGASLARGLKRGGMSVDGFDLHRETLDYALEMGYIDGVADDISLDPHTDTPYQLHGWYEKT